MKKSLLLTSLCGLFVQLLFADTITSVSYFADTRFTGRGNQNELIVGTEIIYSGDSISLNEISFNVKGLNNIDDIGLLRFYLSRDSIFPQKFENEMGFELVSSGNVTNEDSTYLFVANGKLFSGKNYLFLTCNIADMATEGHLVKAFIEGITTETGQYNFPVANIDVGREILLCRKLIYAPGDLDSKNYRIPAIIKAKDGSLVIATDKRKYSQNDLPQDIDILINRSVDNGKTWSLPITIAQGLGQGRGFGDAALALGKDSAELVCVFVGGDGLWESVVTAGKKIRSYFCRSTDNGVSWSTPIDITDFIYGSNCNVAQRKNWKASFFGSGSGLLTSSGRIMFAAAVRENTTYSLNNYVVYSDDNGLTWNVSGRASIGGDEAKLVEIGTDTILMSIRHAGARWYNVSTDGGLTWNPSVSTWNELNGNACNADIIRYTSLDKNYDKNRLLHSLPFASERENVSLFMSYDEGLSWNFMKSICPYGSAYSSLTILSDGTIGVYIEENYSSPDYSMYFMNFSLEWLSDGTDVYSEPVSVAELTKNKDLFSVYYNSSEKSIFIQGDNFRAVSIYDSIGKCVSKTSFLNENFAKIEVRNLKKGVYFVKIDASDGFKYAKKLSIL